MGLVALSRVDACVYIAAVAVVLNVAITAALRKEGKSDLNIRAAVVHMIGDAVSSLGIMGAAYLIRLTGKTYFDPLVTVLIGAMIGTRIMMRTRSTQLRWVFIIVLVFTAAQMLIKGAGIQL